MSWRDNGIVVTKATKVGTNIASIVVLCAVCVTGGAAWTDLKSNDRAHDQQISAIRSELGDKLPKIDAKLDRLTESVARLQGAWERPRPTGSP